MQTAKSIHIPDPDDLKKGYGGDFAVIEVGSSEMFLCPARLWLYVTGGYMRLLLFSA